MFLLTIYINIYIYIYLSIPLLHIHALAHSFNWQLPSTATVYGYTLYHWAASLEPKPRATALLKGKLPANVERRHGVYTFTLLAQNFPGGLRKFKMAAFRLRVISLIWIYVILTHTHTHARTHTRTHAHTHKDSERLVFWGYNFSDISTSIYFRVILFLAITTSCLNLVLNLILTLNMS